ncbi:MAG: dihydropteroate synthase [Bacteroidales bacterium]|nr:dihydropteroate synthase [Bacteroidales bacterium]
MDAVNKKINLGGRLFGLEKPLVMGVLNITPDSFYIGSRLHRDTDIVSRAAKMLESGADILDIGGYSSRPGAADTGEEEEKERITRALKLLRREYPQAIVSLDTFRSGLADMAISHYGVNMINDISGGDIDERMFSVIEKHNIPYVLMHMKGRPQTMHIDPVYDNIIAELLKWFSEKKHELVQRGVKDIIIDPGFGFGKTIRHNFILLNSLERFKVLGLPVMAGLSRKSMIWKTLGITPEDSLNGTVVLNTVALMKGASILRVHDVAETVQALRLISSLRGSAL